MVMPDCFRRRVDLSAPPLEANAPSPLLLGSSYQDVASPSALGGLDTLRREFSACGRCANAGVSPDPLSCSI